MSNLDLRPHQLQLVRETIAADCNPNNYTDPGLKKRAEGDFSLFMEACKSYGLDPFRKQIIPLVFSKNDPKKRKMSIVLTRDGLRVVAQRCGNYRPASDKAEIEYDKELIGPLNPKGIVQATVRLWQQDNRGDWFNVIGEAQWDEFAPITDEWDWDETKGKRQPTGKKALDTSGNWSKMPVVMITKCAEGQALRAGWPDVFSGVYVEEEMDRAVVNDANEIVHKEEERQRFERIGGLDTITVTWGDNWKLEQVPVGQMADRCLEFIKESTSEDVVRWSMANQEPLRQFWARAPSDALEVKKAVEARTAAQQSRNAPPPPAGPDENGQYEVRG